MTLVLLLLRGVLLIALVPVLLLTFVLAAVTWRAYDALPRTEGRLEIAGLDAPVSIVRDERGVPHIFADTDHDAAFAVGFVHAQDRLWQMHVSRWFLRGEIATVLGGLAADSDAQMRTLDLADAADALAAAMTPEEIAPLQAYAEGVNAAMGSRGFTPPLEFLMLAAKPEPWTAADSILIYKGMAFDLMSGGYERAPGLDTLAAILTPGQIAEFLPPYPDGAPVTFSAEELGLAPGGEGAAPLAGETGPDDAPRDGSNAWIVSGAHTASGAPLLANDPHLGLRAPNLWYLAVIHRPSGLRVGATLPGAPDVVIGRNARIAWGMTITGTDTADLVFQPESAVTETREEAAPVRFGAPRTITVRRTPDGPVLPPELFAQGGLAPEGQVAVLRWPLDDPADRTAATGPAINGAHDWAAFTAALEGFFAPMVNIAFAASDGDIGMIAPGFVPVRNADGAWAGRVPFADLPRAHNPADGVIVNANNRLVPPEYPYPITDDWAPPWRAARIEELLAAQSAHTAESFAAIQTDTADVSARRVLPVLLQAQPQTESGRAALARMRGWNGGMAADSPEALIYATWIKAMARAIYADELGDSFGMFEGPRTVFMDSVLAGPAGHWCDDVTTDAAETCADLAGPALDRAIETLAAEHSANMDSWRWSAAHPAYFPHAPFGAFPVLDSIFSARVPAGGSANTISEAGFTYAQDGYASSHGPSLRVIYDLADLDASLFAMPMGQSGHLASPHYRDLLEPWARGEYFQLRSDLSPEDGKTLTLTPSTR